MLPAAIVLGISLYLIYHISPGLHAFGKWLHPMASEGQRLVIAILLFFQFVKISPHDLKLSRWHIKALAIQVGLFLLFAGGVLFLAPGTPRMLLECAMLCMICPTASAAGVITDRLGGNLASTVTYLVMINVAATFLIPLVIPLVNPSAQMGFWHYVGHIALKVFPVLSILSSETMCWAPVCSDCKYSFMKEGKALYFSSSAIGSQYIFSLTP